MKFVAAFVIAYALADVSVLQAYCGNETVGIPAAEHQTQLNVANADTHDPRGSVHMDRRESNPNSESEEPCTGEEDCFGSCSHIVVSRITIDLSQSISIIDREKISSYPDRYLARGPSSPFHPPRI